MHARPLPRPIDLRPFGVADALRAGVPYGRLRRSDLVTPTRGIRWHRTDEPFGAARVRAYRSLLRRGQHFSHVSAALLWGLPLPMHCPARRTLHVSSVEPTPVMQRTGVSGHRVRVDRTDVTDIDGMRVSSPAQTWVECGTLLELDALVALGDAVVTLEHCLTNIDDLREAVLRHGSGRGARRLRQALESVRVGPGSPKETEGRLAIVRAGLPEPELQVAIHDEQGRFVGRVDMAYPDLRLIVEYEGDHHRTDARQWHRDVRRYRAFDALGWQTFRMTKRDLGDGTTIAELAARLRARSTP